ncbi:hypothetical protein MCOR29_001748 [Pyricularia oryzae]|nr:hypothetical protein MCOR29_001748 [Pyricularia oryzae]KAI6541489.1 hypothetical protein MCOR10_000688 [Pyricularia oryzae]KAI6544979.1 hypothetical protein MCOR05_001897 [Pyricularia oryzae]
MKYTTFAALLGLIPSALAHGYHSRRSGVLDERADTSTKDVPRPKIGNVPYGQIIERCTQPGVVAITFDDGPSGFTNALLDLLSREGAKATFFITANNIVPVETDQGRTIVNRAHRDGHQIAHHSWRHQDFSVISRDERTNEVLLPESAFASALGFFPTYIRPPFGSCNADCQSQLGELGYHIINWSIDSDDWRNVPDNIAASEAVITQQLTNSGNGHIILAHDIHQATVERLAGHMIRTAKERGLRMVTVGECLGDPAANWYRAFTPTNPSPGNPPPSGGLKPTPDGTCGGSTGFTCQGSSSGNCCSQYGWCGSSSDHCNAGCQSAFGTCGSGQAPPPSGGGLTVSPDGTCAGNTGFTCQGSSSGNCCSQWGWCGTSADHCAAGCQSAFGTCS